MTDGRCEHWTLGEGSVMVPCPETATHLATEKSGATTELCARHAAAVERAPGVEVVPNDPRWAGHSKAFRNEHPWCGWTVAFAHGSDWDTTCFGLERLVGINVLLTTADGQSRPVNITKWQRIEPHAVGQCDRVAGIEVQELDPSDYEPLAGAAPAFVAYEDIRELVVF